MVMLVRVAVVVMVIVVLVEAVIVVVIAVGRVGGRGMARVVVGRVVSGVGDRGLLVTLVSHSQLRWRGVTQGGG